MIGSKPGNSLQHFCLMKATCHSRDKYCIVFTFSLWILVDSAVSLTDPFSLFCLGLSLVFQIFPCCCSPSNMKPAIVTKKKTPRQVKLGVFSWKGQNSVVSARPSLRVVYNTAGRKFSIKPDGWWITTSSAPVCINDWGLWREHSIG